MIQKIFFHYFVDVSFETAKNSDILLTILISLGCAYLTTLSFYYKKIGKK